MLPHSHSPTHSLFQQEFVPHKHPVQCVSCGTSSEHMVVVACSDREARVSCWDPLDTQATHVSTTVLKTQGKIKCVLYQVVDNRHVS